MWAGGEITASSATAIAETESGKVAGYVENGIYIYKGIPYAKAERFMPPVAADKWEGVRSSRAYGPTCPQGKRMPDGDSDEHGVSPSTGMTVILAENCSAARMSGLRECNDGEEAPGHGVAAWGWLLRRLWSGACPRMTELIWQRKGMQWL